MRFRGLACVLAVLGPAAMGQELPRLASNWTPSHWFDKPASPRIANYRISASLDFAKRTLEASETLSWRNAGTAPTAEIPLHLYLNAFKGPQTLFMKESSGGQLRGDRMGLQSMKDSWGYCRLRSVKLDGRELKGHVGEDESVWWVELPKSVAPGETVKLDIAWQDRYPRVFARSGYSEDGSFLQSGQWFPKAGVYQGDHWNCHAYHAFTEFFSDFGTYDVELSVPLGFRVAHTGTAIPYVDPQDQAKEAHDAWPDPKDKNRMVYKLHAEDVHDFAFSVKNHLGWNWERFDYRGVQVFYYYEDANKDNLPRQRRAVENALRWSEEWYFKYPYPTLTVVDTPKDASGADGMEYPTYITASSTAFDPIGVRIEPEVVSVHEFGHQYFYGMLASNEFEEPWLDEGFNSFFTAKAMDQTYHGLLTSRRFSVPADFGEWAGYWFDPSVDPLVTYGFLDRDFGAYGIAAYFKPTMVLEQLEAMLGRPVMDQVMRAYTQEMAYKHPTRDDFRRIAERVSGRDLSKFWRDFVEGTGVLDYAISAVGTRDFREGGWVDAGPDQDMAFKAPRAGAKGLGGTVTLERKGEIQVPITLWVRLKSGDERRVVWDGQGRWARFEFDSPVAAAMLDPDGNYPMLKDRLHASYTRQPVRRGFQYWSQLVWTSLTGLFQGSGIG